MNSAMPISGSVARRVSKPATISAGIASSTAVARYAIGAAGRNGRLRRYSSWNSEMVRSKLASLVDAERQKIVAIAARANSATALYGILFARSRNRRAWWTRVVMVSPVVWYWSVGLDRVGLAAWRLGAVCAWSPAASIRLGSRPGSDRVPARQCRD